MFVPRLALDAADIATSSLTQGNTYNVASQLGIPLALEAGVQSGLAGLFVPAANLAITSAVRRRRGLPVKSLTLSWQVLAVIGGVAIRALLGHQRAVARSRHDDVMAARRDQAILAGQNHVAVGANTVVDLLIRTAPILQSGGGSGSPVQMMLSAWKQEVATATAEHTTYLRTALLYWRRRHNVSPDLSRDVEFELAPQDGSALLSAAQVTALESTLDRLELRGAVFVEVLDGKQARLPGEARRLSVGGQEIHIAADPLSLPARLDLGPAALWFGAVLCAIPALPTEGATPWMRVAPAVGWFTATGFWAQGRVNGHAQRANERVFLSCVAGSLLQAVTTTPWVRNPRDENGWVRQSYMWPLFAEIPLAILYAKDLGRSTRAIGWVGAVASVAMGLHLSRSSWRDLLYHAAWPVAAAVSVQGLAEAVEAETDAYAASLRTLDEALVMAAFQDGQKQVIDLVTQAYERLRSLWRASNQLSKPDHDEVKRRLDDVHQRIGALHRMSSSSQLSRVVFLDIGFGNLEEDGG